MLAGHMVIASLLSSSPDGQPQLRVRVLMVPISLCSRSHHDAGDLVASSRPTFLHLLTSIFIGMNAHPAH